MLRYMLDTSVCVDVIRDERPTSIRQRFYDLVGQLAVSSITLGELLYGAYRSSQVSKNLKLTEEFCARLEILAFGERAAGHFGEIRAELARTGRLVGAYDMMIGGHARSESLILVTGNRREFDRIDGLRVESWT
jgi:tRNA(fMet)-specific endonuclease VapC